MVWVVLHFSWCFKRLYSSFPKFEVSSILWLFYILYTGLYIYYIYFDSFQFTYVQILCCTRTTTGVIGKLAVCKRDILHQISSVGYCNDTVCIYLFLQSCIYLLFNRHIVELRIITVMHASNVYFSLLDIDFDGGYFCEICGKIPKIVVLDGTSLGIQKTFLPTCLVQSDTGLLDGR